MIAGGGEREKRERESKVHFRPPTHPPPKKQFCCQRCKSNLSRSVTHTLSLRSSPTFDENTNHHKVAQRSAWIQTPSLWLAPRSTANPALAGCQSKRSGLSRWVQKTACTTNQRWSLSKNHSIKLRHGPAWLNIRECVDHFWVDLLGLPQLERKRSSTNKSAIEQSHKFYLLANT